MKVTRGTRAAIELLAPAGNVTALHAAVRAGADAVYLGLEQFNARRGADNFTMDALREACEYCHMRGVSVYVTMNTAIMPSEFPEAMECIRQAWRNGADAFIVQDIGLAAELHRTLPEARVHASTQMNTHTSAGIAAVAALGASRVTLSRELSIPEIAYLASLAMEFGMEVEAFAHGALCVCYSGQCLMSSMIGGRSANRGMCAQACRLPYELRNRAIAKDLPAPGKYLLSPRDLCSIELIPELISAGVSSLKIEGRMKSPEYVFAVTSVYRRVINRVLADLGESDSVQEQSFALGENAEGMHSGSKYVTEDDRRDLDEAFSRGFTTAYLEGHRDNDIMSYQRPNNRGAYVGRVLKKDETSLVIGSDRPLSEGDVFEVWTRFGRAVLTLGEQPSNPCKAHIALDVMKREQRAIRVEDRVFRIRSAEAAFADDAFEPRIPIDGSVSMRIGQALEIRFRLASDAAARYGQELRSCQGIAVGDEVEPARTKAVSEEDVRSHVDRLGQTPYVIRSLTVDMDDGCGIGFSTLHRLRSLALDDLSSQLLEPFDERILPRVEQKKKMLSIESRGCPVVAWATNPVCARAAKRAGADVVYVPALNYKRGQAVIAGQKNDVCEQAGYPKQCVIALPNIEHDQANGTREELWDIDVWEYVLPEKPVLVDSLGALQRGVEMGSLCEVGPHLPITNRNSMEECARLGVSRIWLSPELTLNQIAEMTNGGTPVPLGLTVIGSTELMVTEHCVLMSQGPCEQQCDICPRRKSPHYLKDRMDYEFPVITDALGRSHIFNSVQLDVAHAVPDIISAGVSALMVDTTLMNGEEAAQAVGRVVRARDLALRDGNRVSKNSSATSGHLFRGVQ